MTRPPLRRRSLPSGERARLTALYGSLLIATCGTMAALVYTLTLRLLPTSISNALTPTKRLADPAPGVSVHKATLIQAYPANTVVLASRAAQDQLLATSLFVFGLFIALSVLVAWWMAGRILRPLAVITATARRLSGHSLHERINLRAPAGELRQLADTFDEMLARIEQLVSAQQRFTANAAHELRTQLAAQRAAAEIGLSDPDPAKVQRIRAKLIDLADDGERLLEGLLMLSVTDQGLHHIETVKLDAIATSAVRALTAQADERDVTVRTAARPLEVVGEAVLLEHLVRNLIGNAISYNRPGGRIEVLTGPGGLEVRNTGPHVPPEIVPQLFEPFRRLQARRHAPGEGAGLGLSIVASIARAHAAVVTATANPDGGLTVSVAFKVPPATAVPLTASADDGDGRN